MTTLLSRLITGLFSRFLTENCAVKENTFVYSDSTLILEHKLQINLRLQQKPVQIPTKYRLRTF